MCTIPALILFGVFMIYPTLNIFIISMYKWGGYSQNREFVGLDNFVKLFSDAKFWQSFQNTVLLIVVVTIVTMAMALVTAAVLTREKLRFKGFFRVVFYIPNILSAVVIAAIFSAIYDPSRGLLNTLLSLFTGGKAGQVLWLGDQKIVIYSIAIAMIWQAVGYYMVMYTGVHVLRSGEYVRSCLSGGDRQSAAVFLYYHSPDLDQHPYDPHLFHHQFYQHQLFAGAGHDQRRAGRLYGGVSQLHVQAGVYQFLLRIRYGHRRTCFSVFLCPVRAHQSGDPPGEYRFIVIAAGGVYEQRR